MQSTFSLVEPQFDSKSPVKGLQTTSLPQVSHTSWQEKESGVTSKTMLNNTKWIAHKDKKSPFWQMDIQPLGMETSHCLQHLGHPKYLKDFPKRVIILNYQTIAKKCTGNRRLLRYSLPKLNNSLKTKRPERRNKNNGI